MEVTLLRLTALSSIFVGMFIFNALISAICEATRNSVFVEAKAAPERDYSRLPAEEKCRSFLEACYLKMQRAVVAALKSFLEWRKAVRLEAG